MPTVTEPDARTANWSLLAACRGADLGRFFPDRPTANAGATIREFCQRCPVQADCLADARAMTKTPFGIWGGLFFGGPGGDVWTVDDLTARKPAERATAAVNSATCHYCHVRKQVRSDGMLQLHWIVSGGGSRVQCPGSGYAPREAS